MSTRNRVVLKVEQVGECNDNHDDDFYGAVLDSLDFSDIPALVTEVAPASEPKFFGWFWYTPDGKIEPVPAERMNMPTMFRLYTWGSGESESGK